MSTKTLPSPYPGAALFDLERAKRGDAIMTRGAEPARFIAHVPDAKPQARVLALVGEEVFTYTVRGCFIPGEVCRNDLVMRDKGE